MVVLASAAHLQPRDGGAGKRGAPAARVPAAAAHLQTIRVTLEPRAHLRA
jgi:hypothetical protein